tara:strand:- start:185 stop:1372 length:1188 start_codon:yes stop_codon:yes gene_type:complete
MKTTFLKLNKQPESNGYLDKHQFKDEFFFNLDVCFDSDTYLVSLTKSIPPELMFNENYAYYSSLSSTMRKSFANIAKSLKNIYKPKLSLEIGSNDGVFMKNFNTNEIVSVEPCGNFADFTNSLGYKTYKNFWDYSLSTHIKNKQGTFDLIYSANCFSHIQTLDDAFRAIKNILSADGVFVMEDPSIQQVLDKNTYDLFYYAHAHVFSITSIQNIILKHGLEIFNVDSINVHGGSNRIYIKHITNNTHTIDASVSKHIDDELLCGIGVLQTYLDFEKRVRKSKKDLVLLLETLKAKGENIICYGATAKSSTVFNYCDISTDLIDCIVDMTPDKQNKYSPGMHIPIVSIDIGLTDDVKYIFLGAWNFKDEIMKKEPEFIKRGGKFITHVPIVHIINE